MINEAYKSSKILEKKNIDLEIINMSSLNCFSKVGLKIRLKTLNISSFLMTTI